MFSGAAATPDSYLDSEPQDFAYIHFVAHGTASRTSPLDPPVILSKQGDNYKLYARDIIQHPLHADLVPISACHGEEVGTYWGEGLVGLSWPFLRAGAHGVIAALWEVNDNSTPQLMDHLYSEISKGVPPAVALRDAKLALLHSGTGASAVPSTGRPFNFIAGVSAKGRQALYSCDAKSGAFDPRSVDQLSPQIGMDMARVLRRIGCELDFPVQQTCNRQPAFNTGYWKDARPLAERFVRAFRAAYPIVCPSGSCTTMVRNFYPELLAGRAGHDEGGGAPDGAIIIFRVPGEAGAWATWALRFRTASPTMMLATRCANCA